MKSYFTIALLLMLINTPKANTTDSLVIKLETVIEKKNQYMELKLHKISQLKTKVDITKLNAESFNKFDALYNEYKSFNYDSAFKYSKKLIDIAYILRDQEKIALAKTNISFILRSSGMFKEALDTIQSIKYVYLNDSAKCIYFSLFARTYYDMADYASEGHFYKIYNEIGNSYLNKALNYSVKESPDFFSLLGLFSLRNANWVDAKKYYEKLIYSFKLPQDEYAIQASSLAYVYYQFNEPEKSYNLLTEAAIADIMLGTKETTAIRDLAEKEFANGDVKRAYKYIKLALDDAYFYGARYRKIQISNILPIIEEKHFKEVENAKRKLVIYLICISVLVILLIAFVFIILNLNKKLRSAKTDLAFSNEKLSKINNQLTESNRIKEEYIGRFFAVISEYIGKIEKFKKAITRKLAINNIEEAKEAINNINLKTEREELYLSFDQIFLKIFPGYLDKFNELLKVEERFAFKDNQPLLPELRIIALMRLGIEDPEKIASILNYSIHTIYSYKAKIKTKALIPSELFESKLMGI